MGRGKLPALLCYCRLPVPSSLRSQSASPHSPASSSNFFLVAFEPFSTVSRPPETAQPLPVGSVSPCRPCTTSPTRISQGPLISGPAYQRQDHSNLLLRPSTVALRGFSILAGGSSLAVQEAISLHVAPPRLAIHQMLEECSSEEDVETALKLLAHTRLANASIRGQISNFSEHVTELVVRACLQAGNTEKALLALHPRNPYGLSFSLTSAQSLLHYAQEHRRAAVALGTLRRLQLWQHPISPKTAHLVISGLFAGENVKKAVEVTRQLQNRGVTIKLSTVHTLLQSVVAKGLAEEAGQLLKLRENILASKPPGAEGLHAARPEVAVSLAVAHILQKNATAAVEVVRAATDSELSEGSADVSSQLRASLEGLVNRAAAGRREESAEGSVEGNPEGGVSDAFLKECINEFLEELRTVPTLAQRLPQGFEDLVKETKAQL